MKTNSSEQKTNATKQNAWDGNIEKKMQEEQYQQKQNRKTPQKNQTMRSDVAALSD
jgi:hypothetical protein